MDARAALLQWPAKPVNVDGVRRLLNVSPEDMSDYEIMRALVILACEHDAERTTQEMAEGVRRFADAMNRLERP